MSDESVSLWIEGIKEGDQDAARELWDRYFQRLVTLGRRVLRSTPKRAADEEDVALSAFKSFCMAAKKERFPKLNDRDDLWKLLMTITVRKAFRTTRKEGKVSSDEQSFIQDQLAAAQPSEEFVQQLDEEIEHLLAGLKDGSFRDVAIFKLEGFTNAEIAEKLGKSISFVERKLKILREVWSKDNSL